MTREIPDDAAAEMAGADQDFLDVVRKLPLGEDEYLPPNWLRVETLERYQVIDHSGVETGMNVLEIGCGAHAISTVALAHKVGDRGRVVAVEKERWTYFDEIVDASGLAKRVIPLTCDATILPFPFESFDLAVCVHSVRSFRDEDTIVRILREMIRVAPRIFIAESLPVARNAAQAAHLEMYDLRQEIFEAVLGSKDDLHYFPLDRLKDFVERAGGRVTGSKAFDSNIPHYLAFIPRKYIERVESQADRESLLRRWDAAYQKLIEHGEQHPPVGLLHAVRREG